MCKDNFPKFEIKADITKPLENALNEPLNSSSTVIATVLDFFHNTVLYPMQKYNLYAKNKLNNYAKELENRAKQIPEENLVHPRVNILGPAIDGLKYNLDEEYIKEMFTNILVSDMNNKKQNKVLPAYIEIIKQLSKDDATFLKTLKESSSYMNGFFCIELHNNDKYMLLNYSDNDGKLSDFNIIKLNSIIVDNLLRLRLIEIPDRMFINEKVYEKMFEIIHQPTIICAVRYTPRILSVTNFGRNFIDICLS